MCVHHMKNYWRDLLRLHGVQSTWRHIWMDREERLRRRREQARSRRAAETPEQRESRKMDLQGAIACSIRDTYTASNNAL